MDLSETCRIPEDAYGLNVCGFSWRLLKYFFDFFQVLWFPDQKSHFQFRQKLLGGMFHKCNGSLTVCMSTCVWIFMSVSWFLLGFFLWFLHISRLFVIFSSQSRIMLFRQNRLEVFFDFHREPWKYCSPGACEEL